MSTDWPTTVTGYLRAHGLPEAYSAPDGAVHGLPGVRALAMPLRGGQAGYATTELLAASLDGSTPFVVVQPRPDAPTAAAFCTIPLSALVRLLTGETPAADRPEQERVTYPEDRKGTDHALTALGVAVAALTNGSTGYLMDTADVVDGFDPLAVVEVLTLFGLAALRSALSAEQVAALLARLGLVAASGGEL